MWRALVKSWILIRILKFLYLASEISFVSSLCPLTGTSLLFLPPKTVMNIDELLSCKNIAFLFVHNLAQNDDIILCWTCRENTVI